MQVFNVPNKLFLCNLKGTQFALLLGKKKVEEKWEEKEKNKLFLRSIY